MQIWEKHEVEDRAGIYNFGSRASKHKVGARASKYKLGEPGPVNTNWGPGSGAKQRTRDWETPTPSETCSFT